MTVVDQGAALLQGMQVVPDYAAVQARQQQLEAQRQALALRTQEMQQAIVERQRAVERQAAWEQRVAEIQTNPDPRFIQKTLLEFPEQREALSAAFGNPNDELAQGRLYDAVSVYSRLQAGDTKGAADLIDKRLATDAANGTPPDEEDVAMAAALRSGNPEDVNAAKAMLGMAIAAQPGADKFFGNLDKMNGPRGERTEPWKLAQDAYDDAIMRGATPEQAEMRRREEFDRALRNKTDPFVTPQPGAIVGRQSDFPGGQPKPFIVQQGGGGPASSGAASGPGTRFVSRSDAARLRKAMGESDFQAWMTSQGLTEEGAQERPRKVRSVGEARSLPPGTVFETPDGRIMRVPAR